MPKKKQVVTSTPAPTLPSVQEPPVVFFLKVPQELQNEELVNTVEPSAECPSYAQILEQEGQQEGETRFDAESVRTLMASMHTTTTYADSTACFWCCHGFRWKAFVLPTQYDAYNEEYSAEGHFCSPECTLAYLYADVKCTDSQRWLRHSLLKTLYQPLYPAEKEILAAPDRRSLRLFGGPLDIKQFREFASKSDHPTILASPPLRLYVPAMNTHVPTRDIKKYVTISTETMEKASNTLRIKRSKPVHTNVLTLDQCMNK
jgi:hypothetical protein